MSAASFCVSKNMRIQSHFNIYIKLNNDGKTKWPPNIDDENAVEQVSRKKPTVEKQQAASIYIENIVLYEQEKKL